MARASSTDCGESRLSSRQIGVAIRPARSAWEARSERSKGCSMQRSPKRSSSVSASRSAERSPVPGLGPAGRGRVDGTRRPRPYEPLASTWSIRSGKAAGPRDGLDVPPGPDLELHPPVALVDQGSHRVEQLRRCVSAWPTTAPIATWRPSTPSSAGQRLPPGPEVGIGHRHLQGGEGQGGVGRGPADLVEFGRWREKVPGASVGRTGCPGPIRSFDHQRRHHDVTEYGQ